MVTDRHFPLVPLRVAVIVGVVLSLASTISAQQTPDAQANAKAVIAKAYAKTKTAKTLDDFSEIIELCRQARTMERSSEMEAYLKRLLAWAHNRRGECYSDQAAELADEGESGKTTRLDAAALREFEAAVQWNPDYWKAVHNRGVSYALAGKFQEAMADFSRVLELKPEYANAWFNRAEILFELKRFEEAVGDYGQAIRLAPDDRAAYLRRGHAFFELRRLEEALSDYTRAVELAPDDPEALTNRGDTYCSLGRWEEAAKDYRKAIAADAAFGPAYQGAAWLMATCPDPRYRDARLAVQAAEKAIALDGRDDFVYLDTLAAAYANAGQFDKARKTIAEAIRIAPANHVPALQQRRQRYQQSQPYRQQVQLAQHHQHQETRTAH